MQPPSDEPQTLTVLEQHLAVSDDPCPMCSYNLHKLKESNCPECGHALVLRIAAKEPRVAAFYTGLVGLAAGTGFASLVLLWGVLIFSTSGGPTRGDLAVLLVETIVLSTLTVLWIRHSGRIRRLPALLRWPLAVCTWLLSIGALFFFVWAIGEL